MDVSWSIWVPIHQLEKFATWAIVRDGIWRRLDAVESILATCIGDELATKIVLSLVWVLLLVEAFRASSVF